MEMHQKYLCFQQIINNKIFLYVDNIVMNFKLFIFIFALFVSCTPNFLLKQKIKFQEIVYAFIFSMILFITYDIVKINKENFDSYTMKVDGTNYLTRFLNMFNAEEKPVKININNKIESPIKRTVRTESEPKITEQSEIPEEQGQPGMPEEQGQPGMPEEQGQQETPVQLDDTGMPI